MTTGLTSLAKLPEIGAAYPFVGMEYLFAAGLLAFFIVFFMKQIAMEATHHESIIGESKSPPALDATLAAAE
jgi:hypothetical protein